MLDSFVDPLLRLGIGPPQKFSGLTCPDQFQLADFEKQQIGPPPDVDTLENHSFFIQEFDPGTLLQNLLHVKG